MWRCRKDRRFAGPRDRSSASKATKGHQSGWIVITAGWGLGVAVAWDSSSGNRPYWAMVLSA